MDMSPDNQLRKALWALLLIAPAPTIGAAFAFHLMPDTALGGSIYLACKIWLYGLPIVWLLLVERNRLSWSAPRQGGFGGATALGVLIAVAIFGAYFFYARDHIDPEIVRQANEEHGLGTLPKYILACTALALVNSLLEEYAFRWFIYRQCEKLLKPIAAVLLSALIFTVHHIIVIRSFVEWDITILASIGVFLGGAIWSWCYLKYRSIWPGYVSHLIADVAIFVIGWDLIFNQPA